MNKTLYLVESPFQLLSALEAIEYYKTNDYKLIIRLSNKENENQLLRIVNDLDLDKGRITFISVYKYGLLLKKIIEVKFMIWLYFNKNKYTVYFLGDYHSGYLTLLRRLCLKNKTIIYLDDGASTIRANNSFTKEKFFDWFTIYDLKSLPEQSIIQHNFSYLRKRVADNVVAKNDQVIILGDKFYEEGMLSRENSNRILEQLISALIGEKVIYLAHRGASKEKLDYIRNKYNIDVVKHDFPIELYGLYMGELPKRVVSFFSTALFSLQKIYPEIEVKLYRIDTTMFTSHRETYDEGYQVYEGYMEIIDLV